MKDQTGESMIARNPVRDTRSKMLRFRWAYIPLLVVMALFAYAFIQRTQEIRRLSAEQATLLAANRQILLENQQMQRANRYRRTQQYEVNAARSLMGWTAPGETSIQVTAVKHPVAVVSRAPARAIVAVQPTWQLWWNSFFG